MIFSPHTYPAEITRGLGHKTAADSGLQQRVAAVDCSSGLHHPLTEVVARLVKHEEVVGDHDEYCQRHPRLFPSGKNADFAQRLRTLQPQRPLRQFARQREQQQSVP